MATKAEIVQGCVDFLGEKVGQFRKQIAELDSGRWMGEAHVDGIWKDIAASRKKQLEEDIESFQRAIERFKGYLVDDNA
jgi:hypothetical protein